MALNVIYAWPCTGKLTLFLFKFRVLSIISEMCRIITLGLFSCCFQCWNISRCESCSRQQFWDGVSFYFGCTDCCLPQPHHQAAIFYALSLDMDRSGPAECEWCPQKPKWVAPLILNLPWSTVGQTGREQCPAEMQSLV